MNTNKPQNIGEYKAWLKDKHRIEISDRTRIHYESVTSRIKQQLEKSDFWGQLTENLRDDDAEYLVKTGYHLLIPGFKPELHIKPFDSFLLKTFRKNILENRHWPHEPKHGWIFPDNWCTKINDIIRTLVIVKYLDGVEFMIDKTRSLCQQNSMQCEAFLEAREEGYYAAHLYTTDNFEIPKMTWDTEGLMLLLRSK